MTGRRDQAGDHLRDWLAPLAAADAARLIAQARREAEQIVRDRLVAAWTEVLLDGVQAELRPAKPAPPAQASPRAPSSPAPAAPSQEGETGWYVHCVVGAGHPPPAPDLEGIEPDTTVETLTHGGLTAVVSPVALSAFGEEALRENLADLEWLERIARAHERVQAEIARGGTPIPMRLCSIYRDRDGVLAMLEREAEALQDALAHLEGRVEWGVQAFSDPDAVIADDAGRDEPADGPTPGDGAAQADSAGDGASYLRSRLAAREARNLSRRRLDEVCAEIHHRLEAAAVDGVLSAPQRPEASGHRLPMILNAAYLVDEAERAAFDAALEEVRSLAAAHGIEIRRTGPWPPYNFVPGAIGAAW